MLSVKYSSDFKKYDNSLNPRIKMFMNKIKMTYANMNIMTLKRHKTVVSGVNDIYKLKADGLRAFIKRFEDYILVYRIVYKKNEKKAVMSLPLSDNDRDTIKREYCSK